jgi:hypothetical protein
MSDIVRTLPDIVRLMAVLWNLQILGSILDTNEVQGEPRMLRQARAKAALVTTAILCGLMISQASMSSSFADDSGGLLQGFIDNSTPPTNEFPVVGPPAFVPPVVETPSASPSAEPVYTIQEQPILAAPTPSKSPTALPTSTPSPSRSAVPLVAAASAAENATAKTLQLPIKPGSVEISSSAKAVLAKAANQVKQDNSSLSIAVSTKGITLAKATSQAKALVVQLVKLGVNASARVTTVAGKSVVSVIVSKPKKATSSGRG